MKRYDIKSANDLVFIPCHLNTPNKIKTTKKLIEHYSEKYFVLLGSHIAIPEEVSALADFVFVDKNNPITGVDDKYFTNSRIFCWIHVFDKCLSKDVPYHGYAHMLLLRNAYYLSLGWNFKKFHHVNYDIPLNFCDNNKISHHSELLNEFDFIAYKWYSNHNKLDTNLFSFTTEHQYEKFIDMKTFEDYDHSFFGYSTEEFLYQAFENYNKKIFDAEERLDESDSIENIESNVVTYAHPYISDEISPIVLYDDGHNYNLYFRNATENVQNLSLKLNDKLIFEINLAPNIFQLQFICPNNIKEGILNIIINGESKNTFDVTKDYNHGILE